MIAGQNANGCFGADVRPIAVSCVVNVSCVVIIIRRGSGGWPQMCDDVVGGTKPRKA